MIIRFARQKEVVSGLIPIFSYSKGNNGKVEKEEIVIVTLNENVADALMYDSFDECLMDALKHEIMHLILHRIGEHKASNKMDGTDFIIKNDFV